MIFETLSMIGRGLVWQSALLAAIVFCVLYLLPRGQISARYRVALSGLFGAGFLLALPFLPVISFGLDLTPGVFQAAEKASPMTAPTIMSPQTRPTSALAAHETRTTFPLGLALVFIWLAGSFVALFRLAMAARQGRTFSRGFIPVSFNNSLLSRTVTIMRSSDISAPLVFGLLQPTIIVPKTYALDLSNPETRVILEHEIAHIVRSDLWVNLAQRIVLAILWWCLPLYWINRQIGAERENLCDALATAHIKQTSPSTDNPARMLASALVRFAEQKSQMRTPVLAIGIHPHAKLLARRVKRLCDSRPVPKLSKKTLLSTSLAVPVTLLMLSMVTPRALAHPPDKFSLPGEPEVTSPQGVPIKETPKLAAHTTIVKGRLTSPFGLTRAKFGNKVHTGIDIANQSGTPIYAPADGVIIEATDRYKNGTKWGKVVVIETGGGVRTVFAHLKSYDVTAGQTVKAGDQIAQLGNTGKSTGSHVHIETLVDGKHIDPMTVWPSLGSLKK